MAKLLTVAQFAAELGVSTQSVNAAIQKGRIKAIKKEGKPRVIDAIEGKAQWDKAKTEKAKAKAAKKKKEKEPPKKVEPEKFEGLTLYSAELREKVAKMKLQELKADEQAGRLVSREEVERDAFSIARKVRDKLFNMPLRLAHEFAAETSPHQCEILLQRELVKVLEELTKVEVDKDGNVK